MTDTARGIAHCWGAMRRFSIDRRIPLAPAPWGRSENEGVLHKRLNDLGIWAEELARLVYGLTPEMRLTRTTFDDVTHQLKVRLIAATSAESAPADTGAGPCALDEKMGR